MKKRKKEKSKTRKEEAFGDRSASSLTERTRMASIKRRSAGINEFEKEKGKGGRERDRDGERERPRLSFMSGERTLLIQPYSSA